MTKITIDTKGLKNLQEQLKRAGSKARMNIEGELYAAASTGLKVAGDTVPVDRGTLKGQMYLDPSSYTPGVLEYEIGNNSEYAYYQEFGTGKRVQVPAEWSNFARQFKGDSQSWDNALRDIQEWCKRNKVDVELAYPILVSILNNGIEPQPFLFPAFKSAQRVLKSRIKKYIKTFGLDE